MVGVKVRGGEGLRASLLFIINYITPCLALNLLYIMNIYLCKTFTENAFLAQWANNAKTRCRRLKLAPHIWQ